MRKGKNGLALQFQERLQCPDGLAELQKIFWGAGRTDVIRGEKTMANAAGAITAISRGTESSQTHRWRGESTANSSLKLGADSGGVMDDSGIVKRCFGLEFRRKLSSLPW